MVERIGQQLGNYRLVRLLGRGGFAEVYLGEHSRLNSQAAIKILHTQLTSSDVEHFLAEARIIASLMHPHIVRVLDFDVTAGEVPFLVMDYAPNGSLRQHHPKGIQLAISTVVPYIKQVADALQYSHDKKIIHRDIKPENMLLNHRNEVLLSDFGIATLSHSSHSQSTQDIVGTIAYMAPEQIQGKPRVASDQYSLGIVVYEMLTGYSPFHGSFTEIALQHILTPPPPLRERVPTIHPDIEQVVLMALAKDPHQRFGSVQAFANALEQASQSGQPVRQAQPSSGVSSPTVKPPTPTPVDQAPVVQTVPHPETTPIANQPLTSEQPALRTTTPSPPTPPPSTSSVRLPVPPTLPPPQSRTDRLEKPTLLYTYRAHSGWIRTLSWSPAGRYIASAGEDKTVHVWEATTGNLLCTYRGHSKRVNAVAWSSDGTYLASASNDQTLHVWFANTGRSVSIYRGHTGVLGWVNAVAWSPDGTRIASAGNDKTVQLWNATTGNQALVYTHHSGWVNSVAWSPKGLSSFLGGTLIASASDDKTVQLWNTTNGNLLLTYRDHTKRVSTAVWSPIHTQIASGSDDKTVHIWDAVTGQNLFKSRKLDHAVSALTWSPDGRYIATASYRTIQLWDVMSVGLIFTHTGHTDWIRAIAWSPDGKYIATGGDDKTVQVVQVKRVS